MDFLKSLVPLLAQANKATVTAAVNFIAVNAAVVGLHINVGGGWEQLGLTVAVAVAHGIVVYFTPNAQPT